MTRRSCYEANSAVRGANDLPGHDQLQQHTRGETCLARATVDLPSDASAVTRAVLFISSGGGLKSAFERGGGFAVGAAHPTHYALEMKMLSTMTLIQTGSSKSDDIS